MPVNPDASYASPARTGGFRVGRVLSDALGIWWRHLALIAGVTLLAHLPVLIQTGLLLEQGYLGPNSQVWLQLSSSACGFVALIGVTYAVVTARQGKTPTFGGVLRVMGRRLLPVLAAMLLFCLVVLGIGMIAFLLSQIFLAVGLVAGFVLGIALWLNYWLFVPVAVVERPGAVASLNRSKDLMLGHKLRALALVLIGYVGFIVLGEVRDHLWDTEGWFDMSWYLGTDLVVGFFESSINAAIVAVGYVELRTAHDGTPSDELAAVFE